MRDAPEYISMHWRIRCDGWWRKTVIGAVLFLVAVGATTDLVKIIQSYR